MKLLNFLERQNQEIVAEVNESIDCLKEMHDMDYNQKRLSKLRLAKIGITSVIRAIKRDDYMLLHSDNVPEIDQIRYFAPKIDHFSAFLKEKRQEQKKKLNNKFRS